MSSEAKPCLHQYLHVASNTCMGCGAAWDEIVKTLRTDLRDEEELRAQVAKLEADASKARWCPECLAWFGLGCPRGLVGCRCDCDSEPLSGKGAERFAAAMWDKHKAELAKLREQDSMWEGREVTWSTVVVASGKINFAVDRGQTVLVLAAPEPASKGEQPAQPPTPVKSPTPHLDTLRRAPASGSMATEHAIQAILELAARVEALEGKRPPTTGK